MSSPLSRIVPAVLLTVVLIFGLIVEFIPLTNASGRIDRLPAFGKDFVSEDLALSDGERQVFGKARVLRRRIRCKTAGGMVSVLLTVIDGTNDRHAVHDPAYCFLGGGWEAMGIETIDGGDGRGAFRLNHLRRDKEQRDVLYFYTDGKHRYTDPLRYWREATVRRLTLGNSGPEPLLVFLENDVSQSPNKDLRTTIPILISGLSEL